MIKAVIGIVTVVIVGCLGLPVLLMSAVMSGGSGGCNLAAAPATVVSGQPAEGERWDSDQLSIAATIIQVGATKGVGSWGQTIALAVAMQESGLRNLPYLGDDNDHDSIGVFQQRPSQGWGTAEQLADPAYQAGKFYDKLKTVTGWQTMSLTEAAQAVQISAYPNAYAKWTDDAIRIVKQYGPTKSRPSAPISSSATPHQRLATRTDPGPKRPARSIPTRPPALAALPHARSTSSSKPSPPASRGLLATETPTAANTRKAAPATG